MITTNGKTYRNLEEQVRQNQRDIYDLKEGSIVLDEFGIKVVAQADTSTALPNPSTYIESGGVYGDAYAIGTAAPYSLWILTRSSTGPYWFNIGTFPAPGPTGPQGPIGPQGPQGPAGESFDVVGKVASTAQLPDPSSVGGNEAYVVGNSTDGFDMYVVIDDVWTNLGRLASVAGPQGPIGPQGPGPVTYNSIINDTLPPRYNWYYILPVVNFNRIPAEGEQFYAVLTDAETATSYLMLLQRVRLILKP